MKLSLSLALLPLPLPTALGVPNYAPPVQVQAGSDGPQPIDGKGKGAPLFGKLAPDDAVHSTRPTLTTTPPGGTNHVLDAQNPDNLVSPATDAGTVPNLKWSFSDSKTRLFPGGWVREQVVTDLPSSHDIAAAQQHLSKGAIRELHWHSVVRLSRGGGGLERPRQKSDVLTSRPNGASSTTGRC